MALRQISWLVVNVKPKFLEYYLEVTSVTEGLNSMQDKFYQANETEQNRTL